MNVAKDFCDCMISWEVQENRKISNVLHCSFANRKVEVSANDVDESNSRKLDDEVETEFSPVLLTPFLHPEMTKASYCDLKIFVSPKLGVKMDRLIIISTAKMIEIYDKNGEMVFVVKGEFVGNKTEPVKEDVSDRVFKSNNPKISTRWFRNEYVLTIETFEVMARFCDHGVPNQLFIKYIGVKVVPHDWTVDLSSFSLSAPGVSSSIGSHIGYTGYVCPNTITVNCDKVMEAIQNVSHAVLLLTNEVGCIHKGSNPYLSSISTFDSSSLMKQRRSNSPMPPGASSPSAIYWTGMATRRSSDICNLQLWLETRLTMIEMNVVKSLESLSNRVSLLENQLKFQNHIEKDSGGSGEMKQSEPSQDIRIEIFNTPNESVDESNNSSCQRF